MAQPTDRINYEECPFAEGDILACVDGKSEDVLPPWEDWPIVGRHYKYVSRYITTNGNVSECIHVYCMKTESELADAWFWWRFKKVGEAPSVCPDF